MKTAVFFGSSTGNTESAAEQIAEKLGADLYNVADSPTDKIAEYDNLIFGSSTWGVGDLQDDWEGFISELEDAKLEGKVVAIFGTGDSSSYPDTFVNSIGTIYNALESSGCKFTGSTSTEGYEYDESAAEIDGKFVGLPLDDSQDDLHDERIEKWVEEIKKDLI